eukprot:15461300-Alexandrium_andersonii.AAC.2
MTPATMPCLGPWRLPCALGLPRSPCARALCERSTAAMMELRLRTSLGHQGMRPPKCGPCNRARLARPPLPHATLTTWLGWYGTVRCSMAWPKERDGRICTRHVDTRKSGKHCIPGCIPAASQTTPTTGLHALLPNPDH